MSNCISATLNRINNNTTADRCTKFNTAVRALHGYNVQGVHCFDCTVANWVYRIYNGPDSFTIRVLEVAVK